MKKALRLIFLALLVVGTIWIIRSQQTEYQLNEGSVFGTTYHIRYQCSEDLHEAIKSEMMAIDTTFSMFNPDSWLSKWNRGEVEEMPEMVQEVMRLALRVSDETDGAFDVTVAPLVNAWGFGYKKGEWPTDEEVDSIRQHVGYKKLIVNDKRLLHEDSPTVDFGAIAKGYAVDRVGRVLQKHGVENFMVEIGGEVVVKGHNAENKPWQIGVAKPTSEDIDTQDIIPLSEGALATSGNYRNYHVDSLGNRVAHTIDPHSGRPVQQNLLSATVLASSCAEADAYATAFMVMGMEKTQQFVKKHPKLKIYLIYAKNKSELDVYQNVNN